MPKNNSVDKSASNLKSKRLSPATNWTADLPKIDNKYATHEFLINYGCLTDTLRILPYYILSLDSNSEEKQLLEDYLRNLQSYYQKIEIDLYGRNRQHGRIPSSDAISLNNDLNDNVSELYNACYSNQGSHENDSQQLIQQKKELLGFDYGNFIFGQEEEIIREMNNANNVIQKITQNLTGKINPSLIEQLKNQFNYRKKVMEFVETEYKYIANCSQSVDKDLFLAILTKANQSNMMFNSGGKEILTQQVKFLTTLNEYNNILHITPVSLEEMIDFIYEPLKGHELMKRAYYGERIEQNIVEEGPLDKILYRYEKLANFCKELTDNAESLGLTLEEVAFLNNLKDILIAPIQRGPRYQLLAGDYNDNLNKLNLNDKYQFNQLKAESKLLVTRGGEIAVAINELKGKQEEIEEGKQNARELAHLVNLDELDVDSVLMESSIDRQQARVLSNNMSPNSLQIPVSQLVNVHQQNNNSQDKMELSEEGLNEMVNTAEELLSEKSDKNNMDSISEDEESNLSDTKESEEEEDETSTEIGTEHEEEEDDEEELISASKKKKRQVTGSTNRLLEKLDAQILVSYYHQVIYLEELLQSRKQAFANSNRLSRWFNKTSHLREFEALVSLLDITKRSLNLFKDEFQVNEEILDNYFLDSQENLNNKIKNTEQELYDLKSRWFTFMARRRVRKNLSELKEKLNWINKVSNHINDQKNSLESGNLIENSRNQLIEAFHNKKANINDDSYKSLQPLTIYKDMVKEGSKVWFWQKDKNNKEQQLCVNLHKASKNSKTVQNALSYLRKEQDENLTTRKFTARKNEVIGR